MQLNVHVSPFVHDLTRCSRILRRVCVNIHHSFQHCGDSLVSKEGKLILMSSTKAPAKSVHVYHEV